MDMLFRAATNAMEDIASSSRQDLERIDEQHRVLSEAVAVADYLDCDEDDVVEARRRLALLAEAAAAVRKTLHDRTMATIDLQNKNGLHTAGLLPCTTDAALRETLERGLAELRRVGSTDHRMLLAVGHADPIHIEDDAVIGDDTIYAGGRQWTFRQIRAVSDVDGIGFLADEKIIRIVLV